MRTIIIAIQLSCIAFVPSALADPAGDPGYVGNRTGNPETDTWAYRQSGQDGKRLAFIGPAARIGTQTGDAEKDTWGYQPILVEQLAEVK